MSPEKFVTIMSFVDRLGTLAEALELGLLEEEFNLICKKLERTPTFTELAMFSGMWSEHCSYKNSILLLKNLFSDSERILALPGEENAGVLRISKDLAIVFKIESHNHPTALEPYQGAATGVGGIMRDIFTMGARPIFSLNSLRFGGLEKKRNQYLLRQAVKGVGDYGNSLGIPCAGGEIFFHPSYSKNPLVNAMSVGLVKTDQIASSRASGVGNLVFYVGAKTGRDGIHGAAFASKELSSESDEERSAIQVGDPFMEKLLMEATLECIKRGLVVAIQDMGATGLLSASSEMASSGNVGMDLHLEKVPARESEMKPFEFMLSESQERMLLVVTPENQKSIEEIFHHWDLDVAVIGEITSGVNLRIFYKGDLYADLAASTLTKEAPAYQREVKAPQILEKEPYTNSKLEQSFLENNSASLKEILEVFFSHPNIASKKAIYEQYDTDIGNLKLIGPGQNAGVYKVPDSEMALSACVDGNGYYVSVEPYLGAMHTVAEGFRNLTAAGSQPIGITNCLNFANPYKPNNYYFFKFAVEGMSDAAEKFNLPITSGNVSFYNESEDGPVLPTPSIGMVGLLDSWKNTISTITKPSQEIYLVGDFQPELDCSQLAWIFNQHTGTRLPQLNLDEELESAKWIHKNRNKIEAAIDISAGGVLTALLRMLFATFDHGGSLLGAEIRLSTMKDLLGETAHCYLVASCEHINESKQVRPIAKIIEEPVLKAKNWQISIKNLHKAWLHGLSRHF